MIPDEQSHVLLIGYTTRSMQKKKLKKDDLFSDDLGPVKKKKMLCLEKKMLCLCRN